MALDFTTQYDSSFAGISYWEQASDGYFAPGADDLEEIALLRIPGSNTTVIQRFGRQTQRFDLPIAINVADLPSLTAKRGTSGTLLRASGVSVSAFLEGLSQPRQTGYDLEIVNLTLKFVL